MTKSFRVRDCVAAFSLLATIAVAALAVTSYAITSQPARSRSWEWTEEEREHAAIRALAKKNESIVRSLATAAWRGTLDGAVWWVSDDGHLWQMANPTAPLEAVNFGPLAFVDWDHPRAPARDELQAAMLDAY